VLLLTYFLTQRWSVAQRTCAVEARRGWVQPPEARPAGGAQANPVLDVEVGQEHATVDEMLLHLRLLSK
jgi:hypothetical protein